MKEGKTIIDEKAVQMNMSALEKFRQGAQGLLFFWDRILPDTPITTENLHKWFDDKDHVYNRFREKQLAGMTADIFDRMPEEVRRPPLDPPREKPVTQIFRTGVTPTKVSNPDLFNVVHKRATQLGHYTLDSFYEKDVRVVVKPDWLEIAKGKVCLPKDAEERTRNLVAVHLTPEQVKKGENLGKAFELIGDMMQDGKLPVKRSRAGDIAIDYKKLAKL